MSTLTAIVVPLTKGYMIHFLLIIIEQILIYLPLVMGGYLSLSLMKVPDLSLESAFVLGALSAALMLSTIAQWPPLVLSIVIIITSAVGGMLVGMLASGIGKWGRIPWLLASILTIGICSGIFLYLLGGSSYYSLSHLPNVLFERSFFTYNPELIALFIINGCVISGLTAFLKTQLGYSLSIYGNNMDFFTYHRQSGTYVHVVGLALANACAGVSGYLFAQTNGFIELSMGGGVLLLTITALILGKVLVPVSWQRTVIVPLVGISMQIIIQQLLLRAGLTSRYFTMVQACIVLLLLLYMYRVRMAHSSNQLGV